jgi:hypothetical protein
MSCSAYGEFIALAIDARINAHKFSSCIFMASFSDSGSNCVLAKGKLTPGDEEPCFHHNLKHMLDDVIGAESVNQPKNPRPRALHRYRYGRNPIPIPYRYRTDTDTGWAGRNSTLQPLGRTMFRRFRIDLKDGCNSWLTNRACCKRRFFSAFLGIGTPFSTRIYRYRYRTETPNRYRTDTEPIPARDQMGRTVFRRSRIDSKDDCNSLLTNRAWC